MDTTYTPSLKEGTRVRLTKTGHREHLQSATLLSALTNPSKRKEHQWYDVRFDSGVYGRFLERYLEPLQAAKEIGNDAQQRTSLSNLSAA